MSVVARFSRLQWKLVVSHVLVTLVTVVALELSAILALEWFGVRAAGALLSRAGVSHTKELANLVAEPLATNSLNRLAQVLEQPSGLVFRIVTEADLEEGASDALIDEEVRVVISLAGQVVGTNKPEEYPVGTLFADTAVAEAERLVAEARGGTVESHLAPALGLFAAAAPVFNAAGGQLGVMYVRQPVPDPRRLPLARFGGSVVKTTLLALLPFTLVLSVVFGFFTASHFTRRLSRLAQATSALAAGDLSQRVPDSSGDEIGQLARRFNAMAERLEADTIQLRELAERNARLANQTHRLGALEERHRLARELHDGVKQQLFGMSLATSSALNLLDTDQEAARAKLTEAKELSRHAQAELRALLDELRPAGLDERGLVAALTDYVADWSRREGIAVDWRMNGDVSLPLTHEQAFFRVAQEGLANVARHAQASQVTIEFDATADRVTIRITDNGRGFDPAAARNAGSMGLRGMQERMTGLGGTLATDTAPGKGTRLVASLPRLDRTGEGEPHA